eukprot:EG_transcript_8362
MSSVNGPTEPINGHVNGHANGHVNGHAGQEEPSLKKRKFPALHEKTHSIACCSALRNVKYEIRGPLAQRAGEIEAAGQEVLKCNIGNPGAFGFEAPKAITDAIYANIDKAVPYSAQKGLPEAREALTHYVNGYIERENGGVYPAFPRVTANDIYLGNGVSELIMMCMRALLNPGDEVLIPSPDYPLWTAAVSMHGGVPIHYPCLPENGFLPTVDTIRPLVTSRTRAIVVINPNNPTGVIYPRELLQEICDMAEEYPFGGMVVFADEIYDQITFDGHEMTHVGSLCHKALCCSFGGLSKVYRACGFRVGWLAMSGNRSGAESYNNALNLLSGLRLCSNVPGQYAIIPALEDRSVDALVAPGGRLYEARQIIINKVAQSKYLSLIAPQGAMYAFVKVNLPDFEDQVFALDLVEKKHILLAPGSSFNVPYKDHFRITLLPPLDKLASAFDEIEDLLETYAANLEQRKEEALRIVQAIRGGEDKKRMERLRLKAQF